MNILIVHSQYLDVTKNVFYWTRVATIVAQGSGMHRRYMRAPLNENLAYPQSKRGRIAAESTRQTIVEKNLVDIVHA